MIFHQLAESLLIGHCGPNPTAIGSLPMTRVLSVVIPAFNERGSIE